MNSSAGKLPVIPSKAYLSPRPLDIANVVIFPLTGVYLLLNKSISIYVVLKIIRKDRNYGNMFSYLLANELADLIMGITSSFTALFRCGNLCEIGYTYFTKVFEILVYSYTNSMLIIFVTFLEIAFALERLQSFNVSHTEKLKFKTKIIIMAIAAVISTLPNYLLSRSVKPLGIDGKTNATLYTMANQDFVDNNQYVSIILFILLILRGPGLYLVILVLNVIVLYKFRLRLKEKSKLNIITSLRTNDSSNRSESNNNPANNIKSRSNLNEREVETKKSNKEIAVTRVLLALGLNFLIGNILASTTALSYLIFGARSIIFLVYSLVGITLAVFSFGNNILIYYYTSPVYRRYFHRSFRFLKKD